jgi:BirA family transcriptional regulator, biotin operon repressor / biotin---[acetyl-CoA-carboxylase] ligase
VIETKHFTAIDSTNSEAKRLASAGQTGPLWIIADEQTEGRGRLGRNWVSKPGNLYATFLFPFNAPAHTSAQISFVAALAVHDVATNFIKHGDITLKWPNDCLINGAKFSGILAEMHERQMALGMGLNILHAPLDLPYPATHLGVHMNQVTVQNAFEKLSSALQNWLSIWDESKGFAIIRKSWEARCNLIGKPITLAAGGQMLHGTFAGVHEDGGLVLLQNQTTTIHYAGDVRLITNSENITA